MDKSRDWHGTLFLVESVALAVRWVRKVQRQICRAVVRNHWLFTFSRAADQHFKPFEPPPTYAAKRTTKFNKGDSKHKRLRILIQHTLNLLGVVHKLRICRWGEGGQMITVWHSTVQHVITVYHDSGGSKHGISSLRIEHKKNQTNLCFIHGKFVKNHFFFKCMKT